MAVTARKVLSIARKILLPRISFMPKKTIEFFKSKHFVPVSFDDDLLRRKQRARHEFSVFIRLLGGARGFYKWMFLPMLLGILMTTLGLLWPWLEKLIIDEAVPRQNWNMFWVIFFIILSVRFNDQIVAHVRDAMNKFLNIRLSMWLRINYYRRLSRLPSAYIERKGVGEHMNRMVRDLLGLETIMCHVLPNTIFEVYRFCLSLFFLYILDLNLVLISISWEIFYFVTAHFIGTILRKLQFISREASVLTMSRLQEGFNGVQTVKTFGHDRLEVSGFLHRTIMSIRVSVLWRAFDLLQWVVLRGNGVFPYFKNFIIMVYLYTNIIHGNMTYGTIFPVLAYMSLFENPMERIISLWMDIRTNLVWAERVLQVWDAKPAVVNSKNPRKVGMFKGDVAVENVTFEYDNGFRALHGVSFTIKPASFTGIVGPSGSGKTSMLNLLIRLADPKTGRIMVDGIDIREYDCTKYQNSLGIVLQETFLSKESLRWNLMLGNWQATDQEMIDAMERCRLGKWYRELPHGLDSVLNEGTRLSVGEKQRLGIVRALLRRSNLLLLDEPTSSLDLDTEKEVLEVIDDVRKGKTTIMVTHRLNTIAAADNIIVMDKGLVVETGMHDELMVKEGFYYRLIDLFFKRMVAA